MNTAHLDCKGLPCPQPVLQCKQYVDTQRPDAVSVTVDNEAALQNVTRFLENKGYRVNNEQTAQNEWRITAAREAGAPADNHQADQAAGTTILVCGTCLTHFDLLDKKAVGQTTNMLDVVTSLQLAAKVIRP